MNGVWNQDAREQLGIKANQQNYTFRRSSTCDKFLSDGDWLFCPWSQGSSKRLGKGATSELKLDCEPQIMEHQGFELNSQSQLYYPWASLTVENGANIDSRK